MSNELSLPHGVMEGKGAYAGQFVKRARPIDAFPRSSHVPIQRPSISMLREIVQPSVTNAKPCSSRTTNGLLTQLSKLLLSNA